MLVISHVFKLLSRSLSGHGLAKNSVIAKFYLGIARGLLPHEINYRGHKIHLDSPDAMGLSVFGKYNEEYELSLFESELGNESIVLDVGANIGLYSLTAARHAKKVYCFEPDPISFQNLVRNIEANKCKNVQVVNKAVSNKTGCAELSNTQEYPLSRGQLHLLSENDPAKQSYISIETIALDEFFSDKSDKVDIVKLDVEGFENEALRGMERIIKTNQRMKFFIEFNPFTLTRHGTDVISFIDYLYSVCSCFYLIDETAETKIHITKEWLIDFSKIIRDGHYVNLMGVRDIL